MSDKVRIDYEANMEGLDKGLQDAIAANLKLQKEAEKTAKAVSSIDDGFASGAEGSKKFQAEVNRTIKTQADMESKLKNLNALLKDEAKVGTQAYKDIAKEIAKTEAEQKKLTDSTKTGMEKMKAMPGVIGGVATSLSGAAQAAKTFLMNPIGLAIAGIVGGLTLLFKAFTATDEGGTKFAGVMSAVKASIDVVMQRVAMVAQGITAVFSGDFTGAAAKFSGAVAGMGEQLRNAAQAAYQYELALDALQDKEIQYSTQSALNQRKISELEFTAADKTKTVKQREEALKESIRIAEEELQNRKGFAEEAYNIELNRMAKRYNVSTTLLDQYIKSDQKGAEKLKGQYESLNRARNDFGDDGEKLLRGHYNKVIELDTQFFDETKRSAGKLSGFQAQVQADYQAERQKEQERIAKEYQKRIQEERLLEDLRIANMTDGIAKEIAARELQYRRAQEQYKGNADILLELERQFDLDIEKIADKYQGGAIEKEKERQKQIQDIIAEASRNATLRTMTEQERELLDLETYYAEKLALVAGNEEAIALLTEESAVKRADIQKKYQEIELAEQQLINDTKLELAQNIGDATLALGNVLINEQSKAAEFQKAMALFQIGIDSAVAIAGVVRAASTKGITPIDQAIRIAAGTAIVLTNVAKAKQLLTEPPAYKDGVIDMAGKGTATSDSNLAWLSRGESVITAKATQNYKDELTAMLSGRYEDLILSRYVMPAVNAAKSHDMASKLSTSINMQSMDDSRIVSALMKIKPATSKDIDRLGATITGSMSEAAFKASKKWQA
jgi:hypothetical protein